MDVRLLGPVGLYGDGMPVANVPAKQRCVLAVLAVAAGRPVSIDVLVDRVWERQLPQDARATLYVHVARLRSALGRLPGDPIRLERSGSSYLLVVDSRRIDLHRMRGLAERGRALARDGADEAAADVFRQALDLWQGTPLDRLPGRWAEQVREGLRQERLSLLIAAFDVQLRRGAFEPLIADLHTALAEYPMVEPLVGQLMLALHGSGRRVDALAAYREFRTRLVDEVGIEPGQQLQQQHTTVLRGVASADPPRNPVMVPAQLPAEVGNFVGRSADMSALHSRLTAGSRIWAISGPPGVGKTALAVHWGHRVVDHFPDGQLFVNLRGYAEEAPVGPGEALVGFVRALGLEGNKIPIPMVEAAALYRSLLAGRRMLIVLDNARSAEQVRPLLPGAAGCLVVVTSRDRLTGLVARDGAEPVPLEVLAEDEAIALVDRIVGPERVGAERAAAVELTRLCGRLPLALRIAAANVAGNRQRGIGQEVIALRRDDRLAVLQADNDPATAVRSALDQSYAALHADEQRMFRLLGLVPALDVTPAAAAAVASVPARVAGQLLDRLADVSLVFLRADDRYTMHDLIRLHAADRARSETSDEDRCRATELLFDWYLRSVDAAADLMYQRLLRLPPNDQPLGPAMRFTDSGEALAWLDAEWANLCAAIDSAARTGPRRYAWRLTDALRGFLVLRRYGADWLAVAGTALAAARAEGDAMGQAAAELSLAHAHSTLGQPRTAIRRVSSALHSARMAGWERGAAAAAANLALNRRELGQLKQAIAHHRYALEVCEKIGWWEGEATNHLNLGLVYQEAGHLTLAAHHLDRALAVGRANGNRAGEATVLINLGVVHLECGEFDAATVILNEAVNAARQVENRAVEAAAVSSLAQVSRDRGRYGRAMDETTAALDIARAIGDWRRLADIRIIRAEIHLRLGAPERAADEFAAALGLAQQADSAYSIVTASLGLAKVDLARGSAGAALTAAADALAASKRLGYRTLQGQALVLMASAASNTGQHHNAVALARRALALSRRCGCRPIEAHALAVLGTVHHREGSTAAARRRWLEARALFANIGAAERGGLSDVVDGNSA